MLHLQAPLLWCLLATLAACQLGSAGAEDSGPLKTALEGKPLNSYTVRWPGDERARALLAATK